MHTPLSNSNIMCWLIITQHVKSYVEVLLRFMMGVFLNYFPCNSHHFVIINQNEQTYDFVFIHYTAPNNDITSLY